MWSTGSSGSRKQRALAHQQANWRSRRRARLNVVPVAGELESRTLLSLGGSTLSPPVNLSAVTVRDHLESGPNKSASAVASLEVAPVNQAPTIDPIADVSVSWDAGVSYIPVTGISPGADAEASQSLAFSTIISSDPSIARPGITYTPGSDHAELQFTPTGKSGDVTITLTVQDDGGTANGGQDTTTRSFKIHVDSSVPTFTGNVVMNVNPDNSIEVVVDSVVQGTFAPGAPLGVYGPGTLTVNGRPVADSILFAGSTISINGTVVTYLPSILTVHVDGHGGNDVYQTDPLVDPIFGSYDTGTDYWIAVDEHGHICGSSEDDRVVTRAVPVPSSGNGDGSITPAAIPSASQANSGAGGNEFDFGFLKGTESSTGEPGRRRPGVLGARRQLHTDPDHSRHVGHRNHVAGIGRERAPHSQHQVQPQVHSERVVRPWHDRG